MNINHVIQYWQHNGKNEKLLDTPKIILAVKSNHLFIRVCVGCDVARPTEFKPSLTLNTRGSSDRVSQHISWRSPRAVATVPLEPSSWQIHLHTLHSECSRILIRMRNYLQTNPMIKYFILQGQYDLIAALYTHIACIILVI